MLLLAHEWANPQATKRSYELIAQHVMPHFQGGETSHAQATLKAKEYAMGKREDYAAQQMDAVATMTERYQQETPERRRPDGLRRRSVVRPEAELDTFPAGRGEESGPRGDAAGARRRHRRGVVACTPDQRPFTATRSLDDAIAYCRDEVMPAAQRMDGCIGMSMMCDRDTGRCIATTAWESEEAMHNSEGGLHDMRQRYAQMLGGTPEVQEWEITPSTACTTHRKAPVAGCWSGGNPDDVERVVDAVRMTLLTHRGPARFLQRQHARRPRERARGRRWSTRAGPR